MPDVLVIPKNLQSKELISLLGSCSIQPEAPLPGFRSGSSVFRQINLLEENFEDDGLWIAPSTVWPLDLKYLNREMTDYVSRSHNAIPKAEQRLSRFDTFCQSHPSLPFPGDQETFFSELSAQTRGKVHALQAELDSAPPKAVRKSFISKDWDRAEETFELGREYDWSGEPKKAMQMYRRTLEMHLGHVDAHVHIGHLLYYNYRFEEAKESYRRAIALGREQLGQIDEDQAWVDLDTRPFMRAMLGLGLVLGRQKDWQQALECYQELLSIDPNDHLGIRYLVGQVYHELGDFDQARKCYMNARDWPEGAWNLVWLDLEQGNEGQAAKDAVLALKANAYVPNILLGREIFRYGPVMYFPLHSLDQAIEYCREHILSLLRRFQNWRKFLQAFCSVPEIQDMLDTDRPPDLSEQEVQRLAARVVDKLNSR